MISPIGKIKQKAFTLIELLLVMALIGTMLGMSIFSFQRGPKQKLQQFSRDMVMDFRLAQNTAIEKGFNVAVTLDSINQQYGIQVLADSAQLIKQRNFLKGMRAECSSESVIFYPDGSSTQAIVTLNLGNESYIISNAMHRFQWTIEHADNTEVF